MKTDYHLAKFRMVRLVWACRSCLEAVSRAADALALTSLAAVGGYMVEGWRASFRRFAIHLVAIIVLFLWCATACFHTLAAFGILRLWATHLVAALLLLAMLRAPQRTIRALNNIRRDIRWPVRMVSARRSGISE